MDEKTNNGTTPTPHQQFATNLQTLCRETSRNGDPLDVIVMELEIAKLFIFQNVAFQAQQQAQAAAVKDAPLIIKPR